MRVLLPLNAVPLFSLRASHEAFNRTSLTVLNPVNYGLRNRLISFRACKITNIDRRNNFVIGICNCVIETFDIKMDDGDNSQVIL